VASKDTSRFREDDLTKCIQLHGYGLLMIVEGLSRLVVGDNIDGAE
jgi:hypothetical protein